MAYDRNKKVRRIFTLQVVLFVKAEKLWGGIYFLNNIQKLVKQVNQA